MYEEFYTGDMVVYTGGILALHGIKGIIVGISKNPITLYEVEWLDLPEGLDNSKITLLVDTYSIILHKRGTNVPKREKYDIYTWGSHTPIATYETPFRYAAGAWHVRKSS